METGQRLQMARIPEVSPTASAQLAALRRLSAQPADHIALFRIVARDGTQHFEGGERMVGCAEQYDHRIAAEAVLLFRP